MRSRAACAPPSFSTAAFHVLLLELFTEHGAGTLVVADPED